MPCSAEETKQVEAASAAGNAGGSPQPRPRPPRPPAGGACPGAGRRRGTDCSREPSAPASAGRATHRRPAGHAGPGLAWPRFASPHLTSGKGADRPRAGGLQLRPAPRQVTGLPARAVCGRRLAGAGRGGRSLKGQRRAARPPLPPFASPRPARAAARPPPLPPRRPPRSAAS